MDAAQLGREREKSELLARLAELLVEEQRAAGVFDSTPHFSQLERDSLAVGHAVTTACLTRAARESAAESSAEVACPTCGRACLGAHHVRTLHGLAGSVEVLEPVAHCPACRRDFFPSA